MLIHFAKEGTDIDPRLQHVADAKVNYKHLTGGVELIDAIPKNPSGKIVSS